MRALTVHQPWASLIVAGIKTVENRTWSPVEWMRGTRLVVHASKQWSPTAAVTASNRDDYPPGVVVGVVTLADWHTDSDCVEDGRLCSPWAFTGHYHWELVTPTRLEDPVPCRGMQRLWTLPDDVAATVTAQLAVG